MASSIDVTASVQYGARYMLNDDYTVKSVFKSRSASNGPFYPLTSEATFYWTRDQFVNHCICKMQYVRVYSDYVFYNEDMMKSLALMNPDSNNHFGWQPSSIFWDLIRQTVLLLFRYRYFCEQSDNTGRRDYFFQHQLNLRNFRYPIHLSTLTFIPQQGLSSNDNNKDPNLGPWNVLQCRNNVYLSLPLGELNANGIVVAFDIYPYTGANVQTILSFRNTQNLKVPFTIELMGNLWVAAWRYGTPAWKNAANSTNIYYSKSKLIFIEFKKVYLHSSEKI